MSEDLYMLLATYGLTTSILGIIFQQPSLKQIFYPPHHKSEIKDNHEVK
jgi:hypothetical protein